MNSAPVEPVLRVDNIDAQIKRYLALIEAIGEPVTQLRGVSLFAALKRQEVGVGPYPHVTLFEAANRIMTDLVVLYGVRWLLHDKVFPFTSYTVEFGHESKNDFDITAQENGRTLIGEAFNVAPSFFQGKKASMLRKLRTKGEGATYSVIMFNSDAVHDAYAPFDGSREYHIFVHVDDGSARMVPSKIAAALAGA